MVAANLYFRRDTGLSVNAEGVRARDLEAIVSASGKIQPKRQVNVSANTTGRVTRVAVEEGQRVKAGQFLLEIDPRSLDGQLQRGEASVAAAQSSLQQSRALGAADARDAGARAAEPEADAGAVEGRADHARSARSGAERRPGARGRAPKPREQEIQTNEQRIKVRNRRASSTTQLQPESGDHLRADGRPRHSPQHRRGRDRGARHDEQRRLGAADDRRHVGARSGSRGGRDRDPDQ